MTNPYEEETQAIKEFNDRKDECVSMRKGLGKYEYLRHLPYPQQAISLILFIIAAIFGLGYFPQIIDFITTNWLSEEC